MKATDCLLQKKTKQVVEELLQSLVAHRPDDPVPFIYRYLQEAQKGIPHDKIALFTENERASIQNFERLHGYSNWLQKEGEKKGWAN